MRNAAPSLFPGARRNDVYSPRPADTDTGGRKVLDDHGVNLGQFNDQVKIIFDKSINIGDIRDSSGVVIGDNSSATVNDSAKEKK